MASSPRGVARALCAFLAVVLLTSVASAAAQGSSPADRGLLVHGSGTVYGEPDIALLTLGVDVAEPKVKDALATADHTMQAVRQVFLNAGVASQDIRTVAFNVWREDIRDRSGTVTGERYHVRHSYQVTLHDLARLGDLLGAAVDAGANNVQGIDFSIADPAALQARARAAAMRDAQARAQQLATLAGVTLGRPVSIEETSTPLASPAPTMAAARVGGGGAPVEGGQLAVKAQVTVRYAIQ
ncbi:MAG: SIMPL domain-containing protein [Deinococcales bacterium]